MRVGGDWSVAAGASEALRLGKSCDWVFRQ